MVGLERRDYRVDEIDSYQLVCVGVLSGDVDGREIMLSYSTASGTACMLLLAIILFVYIPQWLYIHGDRHDILSRLSTTQLLSA